jgi:hypothetical protein
VPDEAWTLVLQVGGLEWGYDPTPENPAIMKPPDNQVSFVPYRRLRFTQDCSASKEDGKEEIQ